MEFVSLDGGAGVEEQEVGLDWDDGPVLCGGRQGLAPPVLGRQAGGVGGGGAGGAALLPLHRPGRHRDEARPAPLTPGGGQLQSDSA